MPLLAVLFAFLFAIAIRIGVLLLATWLFVISLPLVLADTDSFNGWFGVFVALAAVFAGSTAKLNLK